MVKPMSTAVLLPLSKCVALNVDTKRLKHQTSVCRPDHFNCVGVKTKVWEVQ